jgi:perosamine synthetase
MGYEDAISWWRTDFRQEEADSVVGALADEHISLGPITADFEVEFAKKIGVAYAVATTSGSVALLMALMAVGIRRDDEVILPDRTFVATAHAAAMIGAKVVLVDTESNRPLIDVEQIRKKITPRTKAIMPVHLNGRSANMQAIREIAKEYGLRVVEDAAQAYYSNSADGYLGTIGDAGCFSLGVTKMISTGQGGMIATNDEQIYEQLQRVRNHGVIGSKPEPYTQLACNFKFNDLLASIGRVQLSRVEERVQYLKELYHVYCTGLADLPFIDIVPVDVEAGEVPLWIEVACDESDQMIEYLDAHQVGTYKPLYSICRSPHLNCDGDFPNSQRQNGLIFILPCGPAQPRENVERVISLLQSWHS